MMLDLQTTGTRVLFALLVPLLLGVGDAVAQESLIGKVGVIDVGRLMQDSKAGKEAIERLRGIQEKKNQELEVLTKQATELKSQVEEGKLSLAEDKLVELQKELEDKVIAVKRFQNDGQRELEKAEEEAFGVIQRRLLPIINEVGREGDFTMIFRKFESGLVYANDETDITDLLIAKLDAATD
jgi:outer membrane protein